MDLEEISAFMLDEKQEKLFREALDLLTFKGFNAKAVVETLKKSAFKAGRTPQLFKEDMIYLISYFLRRGASINRNGEARSKDDAAAAKVRELKAIYRIQENVPSGASPSIITMARIMNSFPEVVGNRYALRMAEPIGPQGIVPRCIMFAGGAALIPTLTEFDFLFEAFLNWSVQFSRIINRKVRDLKKEKFDTVAAKDEARGWADIARAGGMLSDESRIEFIRKFSQDFEEFITIKDNKLVLDSSKLVRRSVTTVSRSSTR
jgi:hypothetical protein